MKNFILLAMGFKENLKEQLSYSGMYVKELAALSGVKKQTIDSYLNVHSCMPSADAAVAIARALGISVEYLVTGKETKGGREIKGRKEAKDEKNIQYPAEARLVAEITAKMDEKTRRMAVAIIKSMEKQEETEKKKKT